MQENFLYAIFYSLISNLISITCLSQCVISLKKHYCSPRSVFKCTCVFPCTIFWVILLCLWVILSSTMLIKVNYNLLPCPSPTTGAYSNSCPLHQWCHPTISSSVIPFSSHFQSFPAPGSFLMSQFFTSGGQSTGVSASASILPMNTQDWFPLGWTGWISL